MTSNSELPLVSVVMPAYNSEQYIELAMRSILNQTYSNLELIVIDDSSSDGTWGVIQQVSLEDDRVKAYQNAKNLKIVGTLNRGIELAKGAYIARMDSDDEKRPDSIQKQVNFLESNLEYAIVGGSISIRDINMNELNIREYPQTDHEIRLKMFRYSPFAHPAIMFRKSMIGKAPYELNWAEDYDLYFRIGLNGKLANLPDVLLNLRTHKTSVSQSKASYQEYLTLYIRLKAVFEYGYKMSKFDKFYFICQLVSKFLMPTRLRFVVFNVLRKSKSR